MFKWVIWEKESPCSLGELYDGGPMHSARKAATQDSFLYYIPSTFDPQSIVSAVIEQVPGVSSPECVVRQIQSMYHAPVKHYPTWQRAGYPWIHRTGYTLKAVVDCDGWSIHRYYQGLVGHLLSDTSSQNPILLASRRQSFSSSCIMHKASIQI